MALNAPEAFSPLETAPLLIVPERTLYRRFGKRVVDSLLGLSLLLIAAPLVIVLAILVVATSGFPPFYAATRLGRNGRPFRMWKLRTMIKDADALMRYWREKGAEEGVIYIQSYKLRHDSRITRLGSLLRKTSLDELPQLWNVVRGDMSLVGPRPIVEEELEKYGLERDLLLSVRPGITGLWQVEGRNDIDYPHRARLELGYVNRVSLLEDLRLIVLTVPTVVLKRNGL